MNGCHEQNYFVKNKQTIFFKKLENSRCTISELFWNDDVVSRIFCFKTIYLPSTMIGSISKINVFFRQIREWMS